MPKLKKKTILLFIVAVAVLYVIVEVIPPLTGALATTEVLEYGKLKVSSTENCWIVRDETVYSASETGDALYLAKEGALLKKGVKVVKYQDIKKDSGKSDEKSGEKYKEITDKLGDALKPEKKQKSGRKGVFSFCVDGFEAKLTPSSIDKLKNTDVKEVGSDPENIKHSSVKKGEPVYKITDNSHWYLVCWIDKGDAGKYEPGQFVKAELPDGEIEARVQNIKDENDKWKLVLETNRYYRYFAEKRMVQAEIITVDSEGLLISNDCLVTKDKKVGCYVRNTSGDFSFRQVQTLATDGEKTMVAEKEFFDEKGRAVVTVKAYDEVKRDPDPNELEVR